MIENPLATAITKDVDSSSYSIWPFRTAEVSVNGDRNNGGIDLVANPELIDVIHEATEENGLRDLLIAMNKPDGSFMTLGCIAGDIEGAYHTYLEFTPRDPAVARDEASILGIYAQWVAWTSEHCSPHPGLADALLHNVAWTYREFAFRGKEPQYLITTYQRAQSAQDHRSLVSWLHNFLCSVDPINPAKDLA